ncbi:MAG: GGDEF domain-containing protein, partial [Fastidiosipila sp.]|nr:GGDEF domain-containing protein [Fastidiosipila sp.]
NDYDSGPDQISVSVGYAVKTDISQDIDLVMRQADEDMYENKELQRKN